MLFGNIYRELAAMSGKILGVVFCTYDGGWWFRFGERGYGLSYSRYDEHPPLFSERYGYCRVLFRTRYGRVQLLRRWRTI